MFSNSTTLTTYVPTSATSAASSAWIVYGTTSATSSSALTYVSGGQTLFRDDVLTTVPRKLALGTQYELPDGASLNVDDAGNYKIEDQNAKVIYRASRVREFNRFLNASDLLEAFIEEVGKLDCVDQTQILRLPIEAFINWLILRAAQKDGDPTENLPSIEAALRAPSCSALPPPTSVPESCAADPAPPSSDL